jgi:hypothetical protein
MFEASFARTGYEILISLPLGLTDAAALDAQIVVLTNAATVISVARLVYFLAVPTLKTQGTIFRMD